jgi:hypothetical protein
MRGIWFLLLVLLLGCTSPEVAENVTNTTNLTNDTAPNITCSGPVCGSDGRTYLTDCEALAANITAYAQGECVEENCTDSDAGVQSKTFGTAQKGNDSYDDFCINESSLLEYLCIGNELSNVTIDCNCEAGRCIEPKPVVETGCRGPIQPDIFKAESTLMNGTENNDTCIDFTTVKDYYCKDKQLKAANNQCPPGYRCNLGACEDIPVVCVETDVGADIYERGRTTVSKGLHTSFNEWDECEDEGMLKEYSCGIDGVVTDLIECGSGFMCVSGRCIESYCSETDNGFDIYKKGTTELDDQEEKDDCINDYRLREYYCYGNSIESKDITCPEDHICNSDRCTEGSIS